MAKKYNNESKFYKDWTTKKLKEEAISCYDSIYNVECYGVKDCMLLNGIMVELEKRGIEPHNQLTF